MKLKILFSVFYILNACMNCIGQTDTIVYLGEVEVISGKWVNYHSGLRRESIDSTLLQQNRNSSLADLLDKYSGLYLKSYGNGALSTLGLRGGSAYQTAVLWNGFSIASPLHGLTDLSLENNFFFSNAIVQFGGASTQYGSGAVCGYINLENKPDFTRRIRLSEELSVGSYSDFRESFGASIGTKKYYGSFRLSTTNFKNNFRYDDPASGVELRQNHSQINQYAFMIENYFLLDESNIINFRIWHSNSERQIPPAINQSNPDALEKDINKRYSAEWKNLKKKNEINVRIAYFDESIDYDDNSLQQASNNRSKSLLSESTIERKLSLHSFKVGIFAATVSADSSANFDNADVQRLCVFFLYNFLSGSKRMQLTFNARKEISSLNNSPATFSVGNDYLLASWISIRAAAATVYRNPTLNDLYWHPGGNKDLKPENGFSLEGGFHLEPKKICPENSKKNCHHLSLDAAAYFRKINDWIIWYPSTGLSWRPQNLLVVQSRGLEINGRYEYKTTTTAISFHSDFFYTVSTNEKTVFENDASLHRQIIYVPKIRANNRMLIQYRMSTLQVFHSYTGYRFTTSDHSEFLEPFSILSMEISHAFRSKDLLFKIHFRVDNLLKEVYQTIDNRPMPLRTFSIGAGIHLNKLI